VTEPQPLLPLRQPTKHHRAGPVDSHERRLQLRLQLPRRQLQLLPTGCGGCCCSCCASCCCASCCADWSPVAPAAAAAAVIMLPGCATVTSSVRCLVRGMYCRRFQADVAAGPGDAVGLLGCCCRLLSCCLSAATRVMVPSERGAVQLKLRCSHSSVSRRFRNAVGE